MPINTLLALCNWFLIHSYQCDWPQIQSNLAEMQIQTHSFGIKYQKGLFVMNFYFQITKLKRKEKVEKKIKTHSAFDDSNWSQFDCLFTNTGCMARINDIGDIFVRFGRFFHDQFR